jgi:hypothetical protein
MGAMDRLHPATRGIVDEFDPTVALALARRLATDPPPDWDSREWLTIAAAANARASTDPLWLKVKVLACENDTSSTAPTDALWARVRLIAALGNDNADPSHSLDMFIDRAEDLVQDYTPDTALASYQAAHAIICSTETGTPAWLAARDTFVRCRRLREVAKVLVAVVDAGAPLPLHLQQWTSWAHLREEDFAIEAH